MDINTFEQKHKKKEMIWDSFWITLLIALVAFSGWTGWTYSEPGSKVITSFFVVFAGAGLFLVLVKPIDSYLRRSLLKSYWIEDHGDVIKLFGSVRLVDMKYAYRDLISVKPGYKIVDDAYKKYGCTIAAVKATEGEMEAKESLLSMGFSVRNIG